MDEEQRAAHREWSRNNKRRRMSLYFETDEQRTRLEEQASEDGYKRFSTWCLDKIEMAAAGGLVDPRLVDELRSTVARLEESVEYERRMAESYRVQVDELNAEVREYARRFADIVQGAEHA